MRSGFVDKVGSIKVTRNPQGSFIGRCDEGSPPKGAAHTTEGTSLPAYGSNAPTFTIGRTHLYQHRGLGDICGTLANDAGGTETNRLMRVQFELVGFSSLQPWIPSFDFQVDAIRELQEFCKSQLGVPKPHVWPDKLDPGKTWATENNGRRDKKFPGEPGWYFHVDIPENEHWDCGSLLWNKLDEPQMVHAYAFVERHKNKKGKWVSNEVSPFFSDRAALWDWMIVEVKGDEDKLRASVRQALLESRCFVAKRKVKESAVRK